jgi:hypothetical protein
MVHWSYKPSKEKRTTRISGPVFSKLALMHTVYEGISTQEEMLFNCGGNGMLVQHFLSSLGFALFAYPYAATIYAESTTFLRNQ